MELTLETGGQYVDTKSMVLFEVTELRVLFAEGKATVKADVKLFGFGDLTSNSTWEIDAKFLRTVMRVTRD